MNKHRILGSMVMRNEADRYLESCVSYHQEFCDEIIVYDDKSTDNSVEIVEKLGCDVTVRNETDVSFMEHEGLFRQAAWDNLAIRARPGDWVLSFDADEFLVAIGDTGDLLEEVIEQADDLDLAGVQLDIPEVFALTSGGIPMVRMDGFWKSIKGVRLFRFEPNGRFLEKIMGCGSAPLYVSDGGVNRNSLGLSLLHYGYIEYEDRLSKYQRYISKKENGHNSQHIASIITEPTLKVWDGSYPKLGVRL